jgi:gliding motility-associated-like protein
LHAVSWGNNTNGSIIYFSGGAGSKVFSFMNTISNDWNLQGNWLSASTTVIGSETPGAANNSQNSSWIGSMNPQCGINNGLTVNPSSSNESCSNACDGTASVTVSGGQSPYSYLWSNSATAANISNLCPGNYSIVVTAANGCSATEVISILAGSATGDATINAAGPFTTIDAPQQINAANTGGVWTADCGACLSASGMFNPQTAGVGFWQICYAIGSGPCAAADCISIIVTTGCLPQTTNETVTICPEDSVLIFGTWEYLPGQYSESNVDINGCDSTHIVDLTHYLVNPIIENIALCEFDSVFVFNEWRYESQILVQNELTVNGCFLSRTVNILLENCELEPSVIYIPNVFTPNGDMINDIFKIEVLGGEIEEGYIFNRWGNIIFTFDPQSLSWDGNDQKTGLLVQDGVYTYLVYFKPAYTTREKLHGFVSVIR